MVDAVFMIHGMWGGPFYWANYRSVLEPLGWRCIATTLPFHDMDPQALPDPRLGRASLLDYVAALEREIDALEMPPVLIGHSMGGLLAQMLCASGRARAAVLMAPASPAGVMALTPSVLKSFMPVLLRWGFWRQPMRQPFDTAVYSMLHLLPPEEQRSMYAQFVYESGRAAAEIGLWPFDLRRASRVDASAVNCPLLVLVGSEDRITPARVVRQVARRYGERAQYRELENHAHWLVGEPGWEHVARYVAGWLEPFRNGDESKAES
ncbi:MAG: alpha/beta hydrolase [Terriglobales bacterium]